MEPIAMTTWNYRIVRHRAPTEWLAVHEVFYDDAGMPTTMTIEPISFACDGDEGADEIIKSLEMALADAKKHPVLDEGDIGSVKRDADLELIEIIDGVNDFSVDDPRSPTGKARASDIESLIASLEDEYSLPGRAAGPLSTSIEWEELRRRLTGVDPLSEG